MQFSDSVESIEYGDHTLSVDSVYVQWDGETAAIVKVTEINPATNMVCFEYIAGQISGSLFDDCYGGGWRPIDAFCGELVSKFTKHGE